MELVYNFVHRYSNSLLPLCDVTFTQDKDV
jgi:hypothetical protein